MRRCFPFLLQFFLSLWAGAKLFAYFVGISTTPEDALVLLEQKIPAWLALLLSMPWWVPACLAVAASIILFWWARPTVIKQKDIIRHFEKNDLPYPLRDLGSDEICSIHQHSDGRVTYRFPRRLRHAPTFSFTQGKAVAVEINQDHITFEEKGDFKFIFDALDATQAKKLESVFGVNMSMIYKNLGDNGFDKLLSDYEAITSNS
jgi:hypothetical protein